MTGLLTLATTCKPFRGSAARIQRNALASWAQLRPRPEILVFGDEPGVAETCRELGLRNVPDVERTPSGTPLVSSLVRGADREATGAHVAIVNADIMLTSTVEGAIEDVRAGLGPRFLLISRRWNLDLEDAWDFAEPGWEDRLRALARRRGVLEPVYGGVDLFLFPRGAWGDEPLPPFAVGRGRWDSSLLFEARRRGIPVVDATAVVFNVHQNHDYSHHPQSTAGVFKGPEGARNEDLLGGAEFIFSAIHATHVLDEKGLRPLRVRNPVLLARRWAALPALHPRLSFLAPIVRALAPLWRGGRHARNRLARGLARLTGPESRAPRLPYPSTVLPRPRFGSEVPPGGGVEDFDKEEAGRLNAARLGHLASLDLPLRGRRVLDVGSGPGHLARFFVERGCKVTCLDGRPENLARMKELYPDLEGRLFDVDHDDFAQLGRFDVVFSYGLLYHLEHPFRAIQQMASVCDDLLLLSTIVADHERPLVVMDEEAASFTQALRNVGCRPTPAFVVLALRQAGFEHVYAPLEPPDHPEFRFSWRNDLSSTRDGHPIRCMFVASRREIDDPRLVDLFVRR